MEKQPKFAMDIQFFAEDDDPNDQKVDLDEIDEQGAQTDDDGENDVHEAVEKGTDPAKRDRKRDAEMAQKRREAEKAAKEKAEKENQEKERLKKESFNEGKIAALGGINPYTKESIKTDYDLHLYDIMKSLDEKGEEPNLSNVMRELSKEDSDKRESAKKADEEKAKKSELVKKRMDELKAAYPEFDEQWLAKEVEGNPKFKLLLDRGISPKEACDILGLKPKDESGAKRESTPSSVQGGDMKPAKRIKDMTDDEYEAYAIRTHGGL